MGRDARSDRVRRRQPLGGERAEGSGLARQAGQEPGGAHIREEADADLGHGELEPVARDPVRAVDRNADAAAHDDAVDQGDIGFRVALDRRIQGVFVAPEIERLLVAAGAAEIIEPP